MLTDAAYNKWKKTEWSVIWKQINNYDFSNKDEVYNILKNKQEKVNSFAKLIVELSDGLESLCNDIEKLLNKK